MIYIATFFVATLLFLVIYFKIYLFFTPKNRLPILMYHQIKKESDDELTVSVKNLEEQFHHLTKNGYTTLFFKDLNQNKLPKKSIIITFDDGYDNNREFLEPLLKKYGLKATIFIPTNFIEQGYNEHQMMTFEQIRNLDNNFISIGLHSHAHKNFREISVAEAEQDLKTNMQILERENIKYERVFAYPYGKVPKDSDKKRQLFEALKKLNIKYALRIGNKINYFPSRSPYEFCRIDVRGTDSLGKFKLKLLFGRTKLF